MRDHTNIEEHNATLAAVQPLKSMPESQIRHYMCYALYSYTLPFALVSGGHVTEHEDIIRHQQIVCPTQYKLH